MLRTDRETSLYKDGEGVKIKQMEDILRTYLIYNVDLGGCVSGCGLTGILTYIHRMQRHIRGCVHTVATYVLSPVFLFRICSGHERSAGSTASSDGQRD